MSVQQCQPITQAAQGCVYTGTMERFYLEPFRVGTDRLPVYMMSWNRSVQKVNIVVENIVV